MTVLFYLCFTLTLVYGPLFMLAEVRSSTQHGEYQCTQSLYCIPALLSLVRPWNTSHESENGYECGMPVSGLDPRHLAEGVTHKLMEDDQSGDNDRDIETFLSAMEPAHLAVSFPTSKGFNTEAGPGKHPQSGCPIVTVYERVTRFWYLGLFALRLAGELYFDTHGLDTKRSKGTRKCHTTTPESDNSDLFFSYPPAICDQPPGDHLGTHPVGVRARTAYHYAALWCLGLPTGRTQTYERGLTVKKSMT
ncbi:hypothetical protein B0T20DRAFT_388275 [Sordaria brevicollis]|uniref:Uncharacterized protein n=1 Tax=Sordaria brevicollis TaxID=83679 RepID=A0AAE0PM47_SORBR|nr:hypothetical protein B0T20DRAFT_388275 [Sordaria brevicollis]